MYFASHEMNLGACAETRDKWFESMRNGHGLLCHMDPQLSAGSSVKGWVMGDSRFSNARLRSLSLSPVGEDLPSWQGEWLYIKTVISGSLFIEQSGEQRRFDPGSFFIIDPTLPFKEFAPQSVQLIALRIPKVKLALRGLTLSAQPLLVPDLSLADVQATRDVIACVANQSDTLSPAMRTLMGEQLVDMINLTLTNHRASATARQPVTSLYRAKRFIRQNFNNDRLRIDDVAAAVHLSSKHLQRLFREDGTSLMRYVWERRLENACNLLSAPVHSTSSIQEIAWRSGFANCAHFSRVFRQAYGAAPSDFKALMLAGADDAALEPE